MHIGVIGCGYVGLVTGVCFSEMGYQVICVDNNAEKIRKLKQGKTPIYEPGLEEMLKANMRSRRLCFSGSIEEAVSKSEVIFIAVDTPTRKNGTADLSNVKKVSREIAKSMNEYRLIVEKSTVPVKTGEMVYDTIKSNVKEGIDFDVASNPEFLREGTAIKDFMHPDRVVIGTASARAVTILVKLYEPLNAPILATDIKSAELIKHSANAFLAMKISFINAIANICERSGADIRKVAKGIGLDKRIGFEFLKAGIGFGGACLPKDLDAFINISKKLGVDFKLLREVQDINDRQVTGTVKKLEKILGKLKNKTVGILGLTYKPDTDDMRNAPSLRLIDQLKEKKAKIKCYDPVGIENAKKYINGVNFCKDPYEVARDSSALILVTEWNEFKYLNFYQIKSLMEEPVIIDGRNFYDGKALRDLSFKYQGMGV